jgi:RNA polymerase sigma-70 factor, ECF subfamily
MRLPDMEPQRGRSVAETDTSDGVTAEPDIDGRAGLSALQFRLAVLRHHRLVYRVACSLLADKHEAEDVTQEAFMRLWQHGGGIRARREWLLTVARNACLDRLRKARSTLVTEPAELDRPSEHPGPARQAEQHELAQRLRALIGSLPEPQRSLIVLFDVHGLDGAACARILGLNVNQVKVYLHRARQRLRRELEKPS